MDAGEPLVLQTGPETFQVALPDGRVVQARLEHRTRRGLGLPTVPPPVIATEMINFLAERGSLGADEVPDRSTVELGPATLRFPEAVDELRARLG